MLHQFRANLEELLLETKNARSILLICGVPIGLFAVVFLAVNDLLFQSWFDTKISMFVISIALIWMGVFNSVTSICSIRGKIKVQYTQGMRLSSFIAANVVHQFLICLAQALVSWGALWLWGRFFCENFPAKGVQVAVMTEFFIVIFGSIFSADMLGLTISAGAKDNESAMKAMPFVLVLQMIFSNALFALPGVFHNALDYFTLFMVSRWSVDALGTVGNIAGMNYFMAEEFPKITFEYSWEHLMHCVGAMSILSIACIVASYVLLCRIKKARIL